LSEYLSLTISSMKSGYVNSPQSQEGSNPTLIFSAVVRLMEYPSDLHLFLKTVVVVSGKFSSSSFCTLLSHLSLSFCFIPRLFLCLQDGVRSSKVLWLLHFTAYAKKVSIQLVKGFLRGGGE
jgi:hypothetical protein